jgi:hypothetical protein
LARSRLSWWLQVPVGYTALFALLLWPIAGHLGTALPARPNPCDSPFIAWVFSWVLHSLTTDPGRLFDAGISYPASGQLTGSEHFLSTQVAFAPLWWLTDNAVLSTNLVALLSYPAAAIAMERLLHAFAYRPAVAWLAGLLFALGPLGVPFNVHVVQYLNFYFPLVALLLVRLRDQPGGRRAVPLTMALVAGALSSYYLALLLAVVAVVWVGCELLQRTPGRLRFLVLASGAALAAAVVVALVSRAYFDRQMAQSSPEVLIAKGWWSGFSLAPWGLRGYPPRYQWIAAGLGLVALLTRVPGTARMIVPGLVLVPLGTLLMYGFPPGLASLVIGSPLGFIKWPHRFALIAGFGDALLVASALQAIGWWAGRWVGALATAGFAAATVVVTALSFGRAEMDPVEALSQHRPVYEAVARIARDRGGGALLEVPFILEGPHRCMTTEPESMLASTIHRLPLVGGYSGYQPPHRGLLLRTVLALPDAEALDDLIDMTHARWVLVRPPSDWKSTAKWTAVVQGLAASPSLGRAIDLGVPSWTLFPVVRQPMHPEWFQALAAGLRPATTVLGTPLAPIPEDQAVGTVEGVIVTHPTYASGIFGLSVRVRNDGHATWPASPAPSEPLMQALGIEVGVPDTYRTALAARWRSQETGVQGDPQVRSLRRDLPPGETLTQKVVLAAPAAPGTYELEVVLQQIDGARFDRPGNQPLRATVSVLERPPAP